MSAKIIKLALLSTLLVMAGCSTPSPSVRQILNAGQNDKIYLVHNIWFERADEIPIENYHRGQILPAGTEVDVNDYNSEEILFSDKSGKKYTVAYNEQRTMTPVKTYIPELFCKINPLNGIDEGTVFIIKKGEVRKGMTKKEVIMSWGNPMSHRTQQKEINNTWIYWNEEHKSKRVIFKNEKVLEVIE
jgi:outer membrane protein assembly factor BamE (lipoprotein component of BamABCDE complex)